MFKTKGISLLIALAFGALFVGLEHLRAIHFLVPRIQYGEATKSRVSESLGKVGFTLGRTMQRMEWSMYDMRFKARGKRPRSEDVIIIGIDEVSQQKMGQWPWPRSIHAQLIETLAKAPPKALLFDILFIEPYTANLKGDQRLVEETRKHSWVVHSLYLTVDGNKILGGTLPFKALTTSAENLASVNAFVDDDGVLRSAPLELFVEDLSVPLLSVVGAGLFRNRPTEEVIARVKKDSRQEMLVDFAGPSKTFKEFSYLDVLNKKVPPAEWAGKVVLVGSLATGTYDHYPTPLSENMPGVEFHANIIDNVISDGYLKYSGIRTTYLVILITAIIAGLLFAYFSAGIGFVWLLILAAAYYGGAQVAFSKHHYVLDVAGPLGTLLLGYGMILVYRFFTEEREKQMVKTFFSQQVSGELLEVLMDNPEVLKKAGERREMTVFFSDVAGFTSISERLQPEELVELLNKYLTAMTKVIFDNGGYVDKYMGDGIMAFWNGLLKQADHAERACRCALQSHARLIALNEELKERGLAILHARIGLNTGTMAAGYMGSEQKKQFTVMGDNVNLGSRLEGANKAFGSSIMISEFTYEIIQDKFEVRYLDRIRVPGKAKPVKVYELLAEKGALDPIWQKAQPIYHEGIRFFTEKQYDSAKKKFLEVVQIMGQDKASMAYIQRAETFMETPPEDDWDGVFEVKSK